MCARGHRPITPRTEAAWRDETEEFQCALAASAPTVMRQGRWRVRPCAMEPHYTWRSHAAYLSAILAKCQDWPRVMGKALKSLPIFKGPTTAGRSMGTQARVELNRGRILLFPSAAQCRQVGTGTYRIVGIGSVVRNIEGLQSW